MIGSNENARDLCQRPGHRPVIGVGRQQALELVRPDGDDRGCKVLVGVACGNHDIIRRCEHAPNGRAGTHCAATIGDERRRCVGEKRRQVDARQQHVGIPCLRGEREPHAR